MRNRKNGGRERKTLNSSSGHISIRIKGKGSISDMVGVRKRLKE